VIRLWLSVQYCSQFVDFKNTNWEGMGKTGCGTIQTSRRSQAGRTSHSRKTGTMRAALLSFY